MTRTSPRQHRSARLLTVAWFAGPVIGLICLLAFFGPELLYRAGAYPGTLTSGSSQDVCHLLSIRMARTVVPGVVAKENSERSCAWVDPAGAPLLTLDVTTWEPGPFPFQTPQAEAHQRFLDDVHGSTTRLSGLGDEAAQSLTASWIEVRTENVVWDLGYHIGFDPVPDRQLLACAHEIAGNLSDHR